MAQPDPSRFGTFPALPVALGAALSAAAGIWAFTLFGPVDETPRVGCDGKRMYPGDQCVIYSGSRSRTLTYQDMVENAQNNLQLGQAVAVTAAAFGVLYILLALLRWRRDRSILAQRQADARQPLAVWSSGVSGSILLLTAGVGVGVLAVRPALESDLVSLLVRVLMLVAALALLFAAFPRHGTRVELYDAGVIVASGGRTQVAPYGSLTLTQRRGAYSPVVTLSGPEFRTVRLPNGMPALAQLCHVLRKAGVRTR